MGHPPSEVTANEALGKAVVLSDWVNYQHTAPFNALVHVLDGEAEITITGKSHAVKAGEIIILPAGQPHALHAAKSFKMMLVMIRS